MGNDTFAPTRAQAEALAARGRVLVSASAGSGKTTTMINKITDLIAEGVPVCRILVLVYNNASGDELRAKLTDALIKRTYSARGAERALFCSQLDELPFAHIGTIHSFCQSLIRENFEKLDISPRFEVLDDTAAKGYMSRAMDETLSRYQQEGDETFLLLSSVLAQGRREDNLRDVITRLYELIDIQPDRQSFLDNVKACYRGIDDSPFAQVMLGWARARADKLKGECGLLLPRMIAENAQAYADNLIEGGRFADALINADTVGALGIAAQRGRVKVRAQRKRGASDEHIADTERAKAVLAALDDLADDIIKCGFADREQLAESHEQNRVLVEKLIEITLRFSDILDDAKRGDGVLSFEDLLHKAEELLRKDDSIKENFDYVFVDEYQDVNPTQEFIISRLVRDNCFMVGDIKQSIYGFRLADPTIFLGRQEEYKRNSSGTVIYFNENFRSDHGILDFVNGVFDAVMTRDSADLDYASEARFVTAGEGESHAEVRLFVSEKERKRVQGGVYRIPDHAASREVTGAPEAEGAFIADEIKKLVKGAKTQTGRMKYGDIVILFRSRNAASARVLAVLRERGIPLCEGSFARTESLPERELICCLKAIDNPMQDIPFAGYLLSFIGGCTEEELAEIALFDGATFYDKTVAAAEGEGALAEKLRGVLARLAEYRSKASFKSAGELAEGIVAETSYDAYLAKDGEVQAGALRAFLAGLSLQYKDKSLGAFLRDYSPEEMKAGAAVSGEDRVTVSTFHAYKGLESPVVFVADVGCGYARRSREGDVVAEGNGYIGIKTFDFAGRCKRQGLSSAAAAKMTEIRECKEEMRLFYVALTRAKQYLYVTGSVSKETADNFGRIPSLGGIRSNVQLLSDAAFNGAVRNFAVIRSDGSGSAAQEDVSVPVLAGGDPSFAPAVRRGKSFRYPHAESSALGMKYSVSALDGGDELSVPVFGEKYAAAGTAYHKVMEKINYSLKDEREVAAAIAQMVERGYLSREDAECVSARDIARCLDTDIMRLAARSKALREYPFMMYVPASDVIKDCGVADRILVQGIVDLIVLGEQKLIIDFKNSSLNDKNMLERYKKQLYLYKMAVEASINAKIDKTLLYSFRTGKFTEL